MRNKAKAVALMLCLSLFAGMAMGSGSSSSGDTKQVVSSDGTAAADGTEAPAEGTEASADTATTATNAPTIQEQVLVDSGGLRITAKEYTTDSIWGDGVKLFIENGTAQDYTVGCQALIVNDYMINDLFVSEVAAGKNANEVMYLSSAGLKAAGIDSVGKIEMYFHAYDASMNYLFKDAFAEIQTSEYANMDTTPNDVGMELYNANGIRIVGKTVDENSFWGTAILLYAENTSGQNVGISVDDMSINGTMISPFFSVTLYNGKKVIDDITIFSNDLEENGITSIDQVELKFHIYNADSYSTIVDTDPITFSAQ